MSRLTIAGIAKVLAKQAPNDLRDLGLPNKISDLQRVLRRVQLGKGVFGIVFDLKDGRVLKVTADSADALSCKTVMEAGGVEGVVRIYDVFRFEGKWLYGIVQDKVIAYSDLKKHLSSKAAAVLQEMLDLVCNVVWRYVIDKKLGENAIDEIRSKAKRMKWMDEIEIATCVRWGEQLLRTLVELRHLKVFIWDLHPYNAGFVIRGDDLDFVLFDLGNRSYRGEEKKLRFAANT